MESILLFFWWFLLGIYYVDVKLLQILILSESWSFVGEEEKNNYLAQGAQAVLCVLPHYTT
jgi:hypothetical protein